MKKLLTLAVCALVAGLLQATQLDVSGFAKTVVITVSPSLGNLGADMPILVRLSPAIGGFSYSDFLQQNGGDLAFADADGEEIPHEIDVWNTDGESLVWVRVPNLNGGTVIHCYYGNATFSRSTSAADVWGGYAGVWHMNASGSTTEPDVSGNGRNAVPTSNSTAGDTTDQMVLEDGVIGKSRRNQTCYDGGVHNRLLVPACALGDKFTVSGWFKQQFIYSWHRIITCKDVAGESNGWHVEWNFEGAEGHGTKMTVLGGGGAYVDVNVGSIKEKWVHLAFVFNASTVSVYTNGALCAAGAINPVTDSSNPIAIGGSPAGAQPSFEGYYDEVRLGSSAYSAERIAAEYKMAADASFLSYGPADAVRTSVDPGAFAKFVDITVSDEALPADVTLHHFQALVRLSESITDFHYSDFSSADGSDMVFTDAEGRILDHEIDEWHTDGTSLVWVKVPSYSRGTRIRCYYGAQATPSVSPSATWTGFGAVWHMNESDPVANLTDSTANGLHAQPVVETGSQFSCQSGVVGGARQNLEQVDGYDGAHNYWLAPNYDSLDFGSRFTFSGWVMRNDHNREWWERLVSRKRSYDDANGWEIEQVANYNDIWRFDVRGASSAAPYVNVPAMTNAWVYLAFVYDGTSASCYTNGVLSGTVTVAAPTDNGQQLAIGCNPSGSEMAYGATFDELRLAGGAATAERIAADYTTMHDAASLAYGLAQTSAADQPELGDATMEATPEGVRISFSLISGKAIRAEVVYRPGNGEPVVQTVAADAAGITVPAVFTVLPEGLAADTTYAVSVRAVNVNGGVVEQALNSYLYSGEVSVAKAADAAESRLTHGSFTVSRASGAASVGLPIVVNLAFGGDATAGADYVALPTSVTIPSGESSATIDVAPLYNAAVQSDRTLTASLADGFYSKGAASASLMIANLAPLTNKDFRRVVAFAAQASFLGNGVVTEFPALVRLSTAIPGFSYRDFCSNDGSDMMFLDGSGTQLAYQVDTWNPDGESLVWVMLPRLTDGAEVRCYYGTGLDPNGGLAASNWPGYAGVWHMNATSGSEPDMTGSGFDAVPAEGSDSQPALMVRDGNAGAVGYARVNQPSTTEDSGVRNALLVPDYDRLALGGTFMFSGWFKATAVKYWERVVSRKTDYMSRGGWEIELDNSSTRAYMRGGNNSGGYASFPNLCDGWVNLTLVYNGSAATFYANGEVAASVTVDEVQDNGLPLAIGCNVNARENAFAGSYDEVRLWCGASDALRAKADYLTVADASFMKAGVAKSAVPGLMIFVR